MMLIELENGLIKAFRRLDYSFLTFLEEKYTYSHKSKNELIEELQNLFKRLKSKEIHSLIVRPSKCKYCYPTAKAHSFHHPESEEFIFRYVIHQVNEYEFIVEECKNKPIPDGDNGMPF